MKKVIVTGGAGFIGSTLVKYLLNTFHAKVLTIDVLTYAGRKETIKGVLNHKGHRFEKVDICNSAIVEKLIEEFKPDTIFHLAAESHVDRSINNPTDFLRTNVIGTVSLLEVATNYWCNLSIEEKKIFRFIHISTDEVYGSINEHDGSFNESCKYFPNSPYSASKASSDHFVRAWNKTYCLPTIICNCSNNYGPYQYPEKLIPTIIISAIKGNSIPIYGNGENIRDWLYVEDHVMALCVIAQHGRIGDVYNISGNSEVSNLNLAKKICQILNDKYNNSSNFEELIEFVDDRPGHDFRYSVNSSKLRNELRWLPSTDFISGLNITVDWYLNNESWWSAR